MLREICLERLGYFPLAAIKTLLSRTKFNHERSTRPNYYG
ncbi:hypothetical protein VCRA2122O339_10136 [Vibrio crassostreae]|nr:hypothetical protein VCRA2122O339_10136 [Vibrio crassostreae]CAK3416446.1 hypothetical protein VCRA2127O345_20139 [Vibrio crassostreae]CAK3843421.1 hypothetical protein VCRA2121O337_20139 [Vibrio crassostreae]CAK3875844.1 hypothetical protein VCRA2128O346_20114 [Vibrio crassostreae]